MTLPDVRTVAVDPSALTLAPSPLVETVRLTVSDPKFTTCTQQKPLENETPLATQARTDAMRQTLLLAFTLRKLFSASCHVIADAASELEYRELILTGWIMAPLDSRKIVCIQ